MFWKAVAGGLTVLGHYQAWIGAAAVAFATIGSQIFLVRVTARPSDGRQSSAGCLTTMLTGALVQGIAIAVYITFILPIVLGGNRTIPLGFLGEHVGGVVLAGVLGILAMVLASLIPVLGRAPTIGAFVQGVVVCRVLAGSALEELSLRSGVALRYPGFFASLGFLIIATILGFLAFLILTVAQAAVARDSNESALSTFNLAVTPALGILFGVLPVFMYMRYAILSVSG